MEIPTDAELQIHIENVHDECHFQVPKMNRIINPIYSFDELIEKLETIRQQNQGSLNYPNALYCLALEIKTMREIMRRYEKLSGEPIPLGDDDNPSAQAINSDYK